MNKCEICNKRSKENTYGDKRYCQGHDYGERKAYENKKGTSTTSQQMRTLR